MAEQYYLVQYGDTPVTPLSTINRQIDCSKQKIVREHVLADGSLKRDLVATKRTWTLSWDYLPSRTSDVLDGGLGTDALEALYDLTGTLSFRFPDDDGSYSTVTVLPSADGFKKKVQLRRASGLHLWNVSLTLREI
jgi:hypothetical protein